MGEQSNRGHPFSGLKKRGQSSRSWVKIDENGNSTVLELDKATIMKRCSLPSRDLRLLDPLFIYPSSILGRERAIVVSLEKIRCIITADEVILMNARDASVVQYQSELCKRLQSNQNLNVKGQWFCYIFGSSGIEIAEEKLLYMCWFQMICRLNLKHWSWFWNYLACL